MENGLKIVVCKPKANGSAVTKSPYFRYLELLRKKGATSYHVILEKFTTPQFLSWEMSNILTCYKSKSYNVKQTLFISTLSVFFSKHSSHGEIPQLRGSQLLSIQTTTKQLFLGGLTKIVLKKNWIIDFNFLNNFYK